MTPHADGHVVPVVIPTVNRGSLERTLEAMKAQTRPPDAIVVVEDTDRRGPSWARNEGIRRSKGDLIAFTDDDCVPPPDWLERLIDAVDRHGADGAGGTFAETDPLLADKQRRRDFPTSKGISGPGWVGNAGNLMYRRSVLAACEAADGYVFNERFGPYGSEDRELTLRLRRRGARLVFVGNPVVHLRKIGAAEYFRHQFGRGRGIAYLDAAYRDEKVVIAGPPSALWGNRSRPAVRWLKAFWRKAFGPFDAANFHTRSAFAVFWIGEKFEGAGFLRGLFDRRRIERETTRRKKVLREESTG